MSCDKGLAQADEVSSSVSETPLKASDKSSSDSSPRMTLDAWQHVIERWEKSNLTQQDFCSQHNLSFNRFSYRLRNAKKNAQAKPFIPVSISRQRSGSDYDNPRNGEHFLLYLSNGRKLMIPQQSNQEALKRLLTTLES